MKHYWAVLFLLIATVSIQAQSNVWQAIGNSVLYTNNLNNTGIEKIFVFKDLSGAELSFKTKASIVNFYQYTKSISDKEPIPSSNISNTISGDETTYTIRNITDSKAYFAEIDGGTTAAIWIVDYSQHLPQLNSIQVDPQIDVCKEKMVKLLIDKSDDLLFYTTGGTPHRIYREYDIEYNTMVWNSETKTFAKTIKKYENKDIAIDFPVNAPLIDTEFKLSGDQFAKQFNLDFYMVSPSYISTTVEAHMEALQINENGEAKPASELGGSAPVTIQFYGIANEPVTYFYTWYIYNTNDMENAIVRYTDRNIDFTFKESGNFWVKLEVTDKNATCIDSISRQVSTEDFSWDAPNFLLLDGTRTFKITYKSVFKFKASIFNRWGNKIYEWTDPSKGWDGRYNGKEVSPGVYFYTITAKDGNGKTRKMSGDINVLRPK